MIPPPTTTTRARAAARVAASVEEGDAEEQLTTPESFVSATGWMLALAPLQTRSEPA